MPKVSHLWSCTRGVPILNPSPFLSPIPFSSSCTLIHPSDLCVNVFFFGELSLIPSPSSWTQCWLCVPTATLFLLSQEITAVTCVPPDCVLSEGRAASDHHFTASSQLNREGNDQICQVSEIKGEWTNEWRRGPLHSWLALNTLVLFLNSNEHYVSDLMETGTVPNLKDSHEKQKQSGKRLLSN